MRQLTNLGEAVWHTGFPPSRFHHLAFFCANLSWFSLRKPHKVTHTLPIVQNNDIQNAIRDSLSTNLDYHPSIAGTVEFTEKNALPGAKVRGLVLERDLSAASDNRAFTMCIGIPFGMSIAWTMMGH